MISKPVTVPPAVQPMSSFLSRHRSDLLALYSVIDLGQGTAPVVRLRNPITTAEMDFNAQQFQDGTVQTFAGVSATLRVSAWYDISGWGKHAVQNSNNIWPYALRGNNRAKDGLGNLAVEWYDAENRLTVAAFGLTAQPVAVGGVMDLKANATRSYEFSTTSVRGTRNGSGNHEINAGSARAGAAATGGVSLRFDIFNGNNSFIRINGSSSSALAAGTNAPTGDFVIGANSFSFQGIISVLLVTAAITRVSELERGLAPLYKIAIT
jgi:hypothetical protein